MLDPLFVAVGLLSPTDHWATTFAAFDTLDDCQAVIVEMEVDHQEQWPEAVFWCAAPVERTYAPATSLRPRPRPEGLGQ